MERNVFLFGEVVAKLRQEIRETEMWHTIFHEPYHYQWWGYGVGSCCLVRALADRLDGLCTENRARPVSGSCDARGHRRRGSCDRGATVLPEVNLPRRGRDSHDGLRSGVGFARRVGDGRPTPDGDGLLGRVELGYSAVG